MIQMSPSAFNNTSSMQPNTSFPRQSHFFIIYPCLLYTSRRRWRWRRIRRYRGFRRYRARTAPYLSWFVIVRFDAEFLDLHFVAVRIVVVLISLVFLTNVLLDNRLFRTGRQAWVVDIIDLAAPEGADQLGGELARKACLLYTSNLR